MKNEHAKRKVIALAVITILGFILISSSIIMIYNTHKNDIINQQKVQIITTAETASRSLETFFSEKRRGMDLYFNGMVSDITDQSKLDDQIDSIIERYNSNEKEYLFSIEYLKPNEMKQAYGIQAVEEDDATYGKYVYQDANYYVLYLTKAIYVNGEVGGYVVAGFNLDKVYQEILYPIQIGDLGYCTVKDHDGIIIMHGTKSQIGINSKTDRKENYPELDPDGVDRLVENQIRGKSGCDIVSSYWWNNIEAGKVKKIIGYTPVHIVEQFWVVSVIMDYSEITGPLQKTLIMSVLLGIILVVFFGALVYYITRELKNTQRLKMEWKYESELIEATYQLRKQAVQVEQYDKLQTMGILTGTMVHEFKNLMTPIIIYCDLLSLKFSDNGEVKEEVSEISSAAKRCAELSEQLLAYVREEKEDDQMVTFDGVLATINAMKMISKLIPKEIRVQYNFSKQPIMLFGKIGAFNQILLNLCTNAYQAMKEKGGDLTVSFQKVNEKNAELKIMDSGCGMDEETMSKIYNAFFTTKAQGEGTGLGLLVVQRLVIKLGGTIQVHSVPLEETTFIITFPIDI